MPARDNPWAVYDQRVQQRPRLLATGGLAQVTLPDGDKAGQTVKTTLFPITMDCARMGEHGQELLQSLGYSADELTRLRGQGVTL